MIFRERAHSLLSRALIYGVLMLAFFVAGIYWYDNHLGQMESGVDDSRGSSAGSAAAKRTRTEAGS